MRKAGSARWRACELPGKPSRAWVEFNRGLCQARRNQSTLLQPGLSRLNRKQRRDLVLRLESADPGPSFVHFNAGGIDGGDESHFAAVPAGRDPSPVWLHARSTRWRSKLLGCTGSGCTTSWCSTVFRCWLLRRSTPRTCRAGKLMCRRARRGIPSLYALAAIFGQGKRRTSTYS